MGRFSEPRIVAIPYLNFKDKLRIVKKFERKYHIEDLAGDAVCGILYMERREKYAGIN